ncbi:uncharacterized protein EV420DRAFT_1480220 [Desarmillaria tabescens]|uniref:Uncharacterized protein n=1 Tax=Armillaria tabescens TaxID=1929756 RepID=A0AA39N5E7_ARMTA|nr:uncharacterized protein EV420DRAFT_1480220 [Desarmillaria tabescens]KAK0458059.1 hypothetical protein EV420DRAFT_1480220 [Desarmillaria tabescens]
MSLEVDLFHYHRYNRIGDGSLSIIGVFAASSEYEYAIRLYYSPEQRQWLAEFGLDFERAVYADTVLRFLDRLYEEYFFLWPEDVSGLFIGRNPDKEQRKIVCHPFYLDSFAKPNLQEIFTLFIMGLKQLWLYSHRGPHSWSRSAIINVLDDLENMVTREFQKIRHVFGHPHVIVPSYYTPIEVDHDE